MSKEQFETGFVIETAKREVVIAKGINNTRDYVNLPIDLVLVLIEQAERVQELEEENDKIAIKNLNYFKDIETLTWKNKRYRDLLEKIKEMTRYDDCRESEIYELVTNELEES